MLRSILDKLTNPIDIQRGSFEPSENDIVLSPVEDSYGKVSYELPKDVSVELDELKTLFNRSSSECQAFFIQKIVKNYPDEVREFLKEVS